MIFWYFFPNYELCECRDWHLYLQLPTSIEAITQKKRNKFEIRLFATAYLILPDNRSCRAPFKYSVRANRQFFHPSLALLYMAVLCSLSVYPLVGFYKIDLDAKLLWIYVQGLEWRAHDIYTMHIISNITFKYLFVRVPLT